MEAINLNEAKPLVFVNGDSTIRLDVWDAEERLEEFEAETSGMSELERVDFMARKISEWFQEQYDTTLTKSKALMVYQGIREAWLDFKKKLDTLSTCHTPMESTPANFTLHCLWRFIKRFLGFTPKKS